MLREVGENIWCVDAVAGSPFHTPLRMTVVRFGEGRLLLHSPVRFDDAVAAEINGLGTVTDVVAPNCYHHLAVPRAMRHNPEARLWLAPGLGEKRPDLPPATTIDADAKADWSEALDYEVINGIPKFGEVVFFHGASKTLITTDFLLNVTSAEHLSARIALRLLGAYGRPGQNWMWRLNVRDRSAAQKSVARIFDWDFQRVIMAHGSIIENDAKETLGKLVRWLRPIY